ncbi:hypothetical protein ABFX02_12G074100 [Erythranthe guttata]
MEIAQILEKINHFTQMYFVKVSELLESGKSMLMELTNEFEERMILIHKEQMKKWQDEIKELRLLDAANEEIDALLHNAIYSRTFMVANRKNICKFSVHNFLDLIFNHLLQYNSSNISMALILSTF